MDSEHSVPVCRPHPQQLAAPPLQLPSAFWRLALSGTAHLGYYPLLQTLGLRRPAPAAMPETSSPSVPGRLGRRAVAGIRPVVVVGRPVRRCPMLTDRYAHDIQRRFRNDNRRLLGILHRDMCLVLDRSQPAVTDFHSPPALFHEPEGTHLRVLRQRPAQRNANSVPLSSQPDGHSVWRHAETLVIVHFQRLRPFLAGTEGQRPAVGAG